MILKALFAAFASCAFCIIFNVRGRNIAYAGLCGGVGYLVYLMALPASAFSAMFLASTAIGLCSEILARKRKAPATLFLVAGMIPIVPGGGMYRSMLTALDGQLNEAALLCYDTLLQAGAIAVGIIAVSSIMKMIPKKWRA